MLPRDEIADAVGIQKRSYTLLRWLADAIDRGFIRFSRAHEYTSAADATLDWIKEHYHNIPEDARPQPDRLREFANYFGSFVTTSFDFVDEPKKRLESGCGCYCLLCSHLVNASHLQPKKPSKRDKENALRACVTRLQMLAEEEGFQVDDEEAFSIANSPKHRRSAAYSAYGLSLLERVRGSEGGLYILALWRMIAWKPEGSPIKGFSLDVNDIYDAEHELVATIIHNGEPSA